MNIYGKRPVHLRLLQLVLCCCLLGTLNGWAATEGDNIVAKTQAFLEEQEYSQAETLASFYLAQDPDHPQMRLLYGLSLAKQGKNSQAQLVFQALIKSYPNIPESYNNLATLLAEGKQYGKARETLEQGIKTNPSYKLIHKNLGLVYAQLAREAYEKALQVPPSDEKEEDKVVLESAYSLTSIPPTPTKRITTAQASTKKAPETAGKTESGAIKLPEVEVQVRPEAAANAVISDEKAVAAAVMRWARAWASKDLKGYFASYGKNFKPDSGRSLAAWKKFRRSRIVGKSKITIDIQRLRISVKGNKAQARFHQRYRAGSFKNSTNKTLSFEKEKGKWVIVSERT